MDKQWLAELIKKRRTRKPYKFHSPVNSEKIVGLIDQARHAPNHHRTEPARFYLLDDSRICHLAKLFGEIIRGSGSNPTLLEKASRKEQQWRKAKGLLVITCFSDTESILIQKNPEVIEENFATTCCIVQNLLLLFESSGIAAKWSTAPVWNHPEFHSVIGIKNPVQEKVVALLFYGYANMDLEFRQLVPLESHLINYSNTKENV